MGHYPKAIVGPPVGTQPRALDGFAQILHCSGKIIHIMRMDTKTEGPLELETARMWSLIL